MNVIFEKILEDKISLLYPSSSIKSFKESKCIVAWCFSIKTCVSNIASFAYNFGDIWQGAHFKLVSTSKPAL